MAPPPTGRRVGGEHDAGMVPERAVGGQRLGGEHIEDRRVGPTPFEQTFQPVAICASLGYSRVGNYGGNCGNTCGGCGDFGTSCSSLGRQGFDQLGLLSNGPDGPVIGQTVHWLCLR